MAVVESEVAVGCPVPPYTPHAISVSLPKWRDNVGYEEGDKRVIDCMVNGYPRFFIHLSIVKLASVCERRYAVENEKCMLFPTKKVAEHCKTFIQHRLNTTGSPGHTRLVQVFVCPENKNPGYESIANSSVDLHIVIFPKDSFPIAKEFWQHTGLGISSRLAEKCLSLLPEGMPSSTTTSPRQFAGNYGVKRHNRHYSSAKSSDLCSSLVDHPTSNIKGEDICADRATYVEERYGRNLPKGAAALAKQALQCRVAGVLVEENLHESPSQPPASHQGLADCNGTGDIQISPDDVYIYPCGMAAIWCAHDILLNIHSPAKSVCFGFPYTDTLKILQKWGPGCHFFGHGLDTDIDALETLLEEEVGRNPNKKPLLALFTEFPSNPLLRSANLPRLRALADRYDFFIVVDDTIGNYVNVRVLPYADIVVSSLTKVFSGASNVMGGSLVLNPKGRHYATLKTYLKQNFEDLYFDEDAIYLERNSRDVKRRIRVIDANAEAACDFLQPRSVAGGVPSSPIKEVFYPKYITRENYEICRKKGIDSEDGMTGGFGGLFSLSFTSTSASEAFFDTLQCYKGPSLGTNFTLACPFTILAHFVELDWARQWGVEENLIRISVGMEDSATLLSWIKTAFEAAEAVRT